MQYEGKKLRHELKYYISYDTYYILRERLKNVIDKDPNMTDENGYIITSLYLDDMYHSAVEEKIAGIRFRKKFRIRSYERDDKLIRLECKSKCNEYISKDGAKISVEEYQKILAGDYDFLIKRPEKVCRELFGYSRLKRMKPVVVVEYQREAYISPLGNVRITFDKDISASNVLNMFSKDFYTQKVLPDDIMVLEVKYDDYLPVHIKGMLQGISAEHCAISKYVMCREEKRRVNFV